MNTFLGLVLVLVLNTAIWSQGGEGANCGFAFHVDDTQCGNGCVSQTFTAPASASDYEFTCQLLNCSDGYGIECRITAELVSVLGGGPIITCDNRNQEHCDETLPAGTPIALVQGIQYRLTVCMDACYSGCSGCDGCTARASICRP